MRLPKMRITEFGGLCWSPPLCGKATRSCIALVFQGRKPVSVAHIMHGYLSLPLLLPSPTCCRNNLKHCLLCVLRLEPMPSGAARVRARSRFPVFAFALPEQNRHPTSICLRFTQIGGSPKSLQAPTTEKPPAAPRLKQHQNQGFQN